MTKQLLLGSGLALALLAGCSPKELILPGERLDLRDGLASAAVTEVNTTRALNAGAPVANADWAQIGGNAQHLMPHPALATSPQLAFVAAIGRGDTRHGRLSIDPAVAGGVVYTIDSEAQLVATSTAGARLWAVSMVPAGETVTGIGGGIAIDGGVVYATTGFGEVWALDAATGAVLWRQDLNAAGASAPTVAGNDLFVVARNGRGWAIDKATGQTRWTVTGAGSVSQFGASAPVAVSGDTVVFPFDSGQLVATYRNGGTRKWSSAVVGDRIGRPVGVMSGVSGAPVLSGQTVYAANATGQMSAIDLRTGQIRWTADEGAVGQMWVAGGSIFAVNDINQLIRLDAENGAVIWRVALPDLIEKRFGRSRAAVAHYGPVLAGGQVIVASSDGQLRLFDPVSGAQTGAVSLPKGAASAPVVAGGVLYVVNKDGQLLAFR